MYKVTNKAAAIREIQTYLRSLSYREGAYAHVPKDGRYGSETRTAVAQFQEQHGLSVTGEVDLSTFRCLERMAGMPDRQKTHLSLAPLSYGMQTVAVRAYHILLSLFDGLHPHKIDPPSHGYYGADSERATQKLAVFFGLSPTRELSAELEGRLRSYLHTFLSDRRATE